MAHNYAAGPQAYHQLNPTMLAIYTFCAVCEKDKNLQFESNESLTILCLKNNTDVGNYSLDIHKQILIIFFIN